MSCLCEDCACKREGKVAVDREEYDWLTSCAEVDVNLRNAAGQVVDMGLDPDFQPSDEFKLWLGRLKEELLKDTS